jgi:hypothetical protein
MITALDVLAAADRYIPAVCICVCLQAAWPPASGEVQNAGLLRLYIFVYMGTDLRGTISPYSL